MNDREVKSYRDLQVWQKAMELVENCYRTVRQLPASEMYGLTSQIQRSAVSIPANIAEGKGREHLGDYRRHVSIARGSLMELETHLLIAHRLNYITSSELDPLLQKTDEISRMLSGLRSKLKEKLERRKERGNLES